MNYATNYVGRTLGNSRRSPSAQHQLELAFAASASCQRFSHPPRRRSRAAWWFQRMRQIVDHACGWEPALQARPEQSWFPGSHREISTAP